MDRRERFDDQQTALLAALQGAQAELWTAMPGFIKSFNTAEMTCEVQLTTRFRINPPAVDTYKSATKIDDQSGNYSWDQMPLLVDCPVVFPSGGGCTLTFPLKAGDECLVIFASRCIDAWWQNGGIQNQAILRMHDLSDGFVIPGPKSLPKIIPAISTTSVQLRSDDGQAYVEIDPTSHAIKASTPATIEALAGGNIVATSGASIVASAAAEITMTAPTVKITSSNIVLDGPITQTNSLGGGTTASLIGPLTVVNDVTATGTSLRTHTHTDPQGGNTGPPT